MYVPGGGNRDELRAGDSAAKCFAIYRGDHPIVLAPDDHGPGPDTVKPLGKAAIRHREQQFARHRQLARITDHERFEKFRIIEISVRRH